MANPERKAGTDRDGCTMGRVIYESHNAKRGRLASAVQEAKVVVRKQK
jgi:hypothetical protein